jgi:1-acyl-sn-glycerol-3-phosphate acyltransferase
MVGLMDSSPWRVPLAWRMMLAFSRFVVFPLCRLRVSGDIPAELRAGPAILAANHISPFDPIVMAAACHQVGIAPRFMATGGLFDAPVAGAAMRAAGHIRVDRGNATVARALPEAEQALRGGALVLVYPEGRIGLDPWMWPERGKTGVARLAQASGAPVVPVAQWGTHAVMPYAAPRGLVKSVLTAMWRRPVVRVRFGTPVDLSGIAGPPGAQAMRATRVIMAGIDDTLAVLRADEMQVPRHVDHTRPPDLSRVRPRPEQKTDPGHRAGPSAGTRLSDQ